MARRLPSLNQLRAFEAAARLSSFKDGASELCVTQAAVSHQIAALEQALGVRLFHRDARGARLTDEAKPFAAALTAALDAIAEATAQLAITKPAGILRVSAPPFWGNRWLLPRLPGFRALRPDIDVRVSLSVDLVDLLRSGFDAALRFGEGPWPGLADLLIAGNAVGPVGAPRCLAGARAPLEPQAILGMVLATTGGDTQDWLDWFAAAGVAASSEDLRTFDHENSAFAFDAALSGNAVCLSDVRLTASDEEGGTLVRLHPLTIERSRGMRLVFRETSVPNPHLTAFADWLRNEAAKPKQGAKPAERCAH